MDAMFLPSLIIIGMVTLMYISDNIANAIKTYSDKRDKANKAWNTKYTDDYLEDLDERIKRLQNDRIKKVEGIERYRNFKRKTGCS